MHILEAHTIVHGAFAAETGLHTIPPAMVGADKANDKLPSGIEAREADRGHHRFRAAGMEGYFVETGNTLQKLHVVGD